MRKEKLRPFTYYELMGLDRGCTTLDINNQYDRLKRIYVSENTMLREVFDDEGLFIFNTLMDYVHKQLSDPELRREYDMEIDEHLGSLEESFPETFILSDVVRRYNRSKKGPAKLIKKDVYGRDAEKKKPAEDLDFVDINKIFEKYADDIIDGEKLKQIREESGISLKSIISNTKISSFVVNAIEANSYDKLPAQIYVKGFLRNYCKAIKIKTEYGEKVIKDYVSLMATQKHVEESTEE